MWEKTEYNGVHTIIINTEDPKNSTRSGIIGTISEEGSHIIGKIEGRQRETGTEEKGFESTGRAMNEYFTDKYKKNDIPIETKSDGKDYSNIDFGENVGDRFVLQNAPYVKQYIFPKNLKNEGEKYPVLYIDEEYPKEYNRLMKLPRVIDGFEKNLFSIETDLANLISKRNLKINESYEIPKHPSDAMVPYKLYKEKKKLVNLTFAGGFSWGHTYVRTQVKNVIVNRTNKGYKINITYIERLEDSFDDTLDTFNKWKGNQEISGSTPYIMKTSNKRYSVQIEVKNLGEISSKLIRRRNKRE